MSLYDPAVDGRCVCVCEAGIMEHKGIEYWIVQTANPTGFRWFAKLGDKTQTGVSSSKGNAIFNAIRAIDKALKAREPEPG